jgi:hypothetical protein
LAADSEAMNVCGFGLRNIRPEQSIFELKFDRAGDFAVAFGDIEKSVGDVISDPSG